MSQKKIQFSGSQGQLAAVLEFPSDAAPRGYALFAHCFTCTKDIFSARYLTTGLVARGFAVLRFDFTGLGASEGDFANTNFSSNVQDLICAADYLRNEHQAPTLIVGHSLGGAAVLAAAGDIPETRAVATVGAPAEPAHVQHLFSDVRESIERDGEAQVQLGGYPFRIKKQFLEDIEGVRLAERISTLNKALLILHSVVDTTVDIDNARKIYAAAKHPKSFVSLDTADHLLSDKRDATYAADVLATWAERYLPAPITAATDEVTEDAQTVIVTESGAGLAQRIYNGKHELVADEPSSLGGANTGPTPYGYLLGALGACSTITLRMYAQRKNIPLAKVTVTLQHQKIHASDCEHCDSKEKIDSIERVFTLEGQLTDEQRATLLAIADKCPVHKTLQGTININTTLKK
ncbi:bifunctional alpha/beta hydrolase/OsmC family protein [Candidatus Persebacteraceae bacterium Df01]|jgi:putative redox protein|uniref:Bifunctional alpha/beta hydrolase/OsmC family protein n=1 Tax=Candidatus Doriopsillibacter californiensis TaxID=2970740 RepID=A0ABT7QND6_9GAMM|nr:bifunctional alpha/beta hydrolase/OsmC family protein [Candidatus Persebacteraceae bacterium Df01]